MPKLIDYPRTSYPGAWEVAEVVDDTGGKSALETCARKLNRKVSGSFKAIVGSAVKFGLLTSKREILTTTTLFRRIKHAYDKQEELLFHREAFLTPPLFMQLCRKFRSRELPVAMLDVLLIREFGVEEINAQGVAKAFTDGARMVGLLDEHNIMANVDQLVTQPSPRRELASPPPTPNNFRQAAGNGKESNEEGNNIANSLLLDDTIPTDTGKTRVVIQTATPSPANVPLTRGNLPLPASRPAPPETTDAIAHLFGLDATTKANHTPTITTATTVNQGTSPSAVVSTPEVTQPNSSQDIIESVTSTESSPFTLASGFNKLLFRLQLTGPGLETTLDVTDADDLLLVRALLDKIERQLKRT